MQYIRKNFNFQKYILWSVWGSQSKTKMSVFFLQQITVQKHIFLKDLCVFLQFSLWFYMIFADGRFLHFFWDSLIWHFTVCFFMKT